MAIGIQYGAIRHDVQQQNAVMEGKFIMVYHLRGGSDFNVTFMINRGICGACGENIGLDILRHKMYLLKFSMGNAIDRCIGGSIQIALRVLRKTNEFFRRLRRNPFLPCFALEYPHSPNATYRHTPIGKWLNTAQNRKGQFSRARLESGNPIFDHCKAPFGRVKPHLSRFIE